MRSIPKAAETGSDDLHPDEPPKQAPWTPPATADGAIDWHKVPKSLPQRETDFHWNAEERREKQAHDRKVIEDLRRMEEAKLERDKLKQGVPIPPKPTAIDRILLEWAMPKDLSALRLEYLVDPFLPAKCVVGFFGRGSTAKSSFLATLAARISEDWSTLWISVEEPGDWITQRHLSAGGEDGTLAVFRFEATKRDAQGRVIGSAFDVYRDLESSILKAKQGPAQLRPDHPRPLRLVVLDTAVGLTGWGKGESPNDDASVKRLLAYLQALAEQHNLSIAVIGHANKGRHDHFADTVAGSGAWTNSPRLSFIHARDRREEHAYVMRVAKSNLSSSFAVAYRTEPVLMLHQHEDGHASVMCRVDMEPVVWGEEESLELYEAATHKPDEEGGGDNHKVGLVENVLMAVVELVHGSGQPVTRDAVHARLGREVTRREWVKVDERLRLSAFQYKVSITAGPQNKAIYQKLT